MKAVGPVCCMDVLHTPVLLASLQVLVSLRTILLVFLLGVFFSFFLRIRLRFRVDLGFDGPPTCNTSTLKGTLCGVLGYSIHSNIQPI